MPSKRNHEEGLVDEESSRVAKEKLCWEKSQAAMKRAMLRSLELQGDQSKKSRDAYSVTRKLWTNFCRENGCSDGTIVTEGKAVWFLEELTIKPDIPHRRTTSARVAKRRKIINYYESEVEESDMYSTDSSVQAPQSRRKSRPDFPVHDNRPDERTNPRPNPAPAQGGLQEEIQGLHSQGYENPGSKTEWTAPSFEVVESHFLALIEMWNEQNTFGSHQYPDPRGAALTAFMEVYKKEEATRHPEAHNASETGAEADVRSSLKDLVTEVADLKSKLLSSRDKNYAKLGRIMTDLEENKRELQSQKMGVRMVDDKLNKILAIQEAFTSGKIGLFPKAMDPSPVPAGGQAAYTKFTGTTVSGCHVWKG